MARSAQSVGAALMVPQVLTLLGTIFGGTGRAWAFRWVGITLGLASGSGQLIGSALIDLDAFGLGWRSCFLINIPIGLGALMAVRRTLPEDAEIGDRRLDRVGAVLITSAMAALVLPLIEGRQRGWPLWTIGSFVVAASHLYLFAISLVVAGLLHSQRKLRTGSPEWRHEQANRFDRPRR